MRFVLRTFLILPALILALVMIPAMVVTTAGIASGASLPEILAASSHFDPAAVTAFASPPNGTVPSPLPPPPPPPPPPPGPIVRPVRPAPTPTPAIAFLPNQVAIFPHAVTKVIGDRHSATIYAFVKNGALYRSNDNGRLWQLVRPKGIVDDFMMSSADPNVLYSGKGVNCADSAAPNEPFYRSVDSGVTWQEAPTGINLRPLLIDPADPNRLFAADCTMLYLSTDGGSSWQEKPDASSAQLWATYRVVAMASASLVGDPAPDTPHWNQLYAIGVNADGLGVVAFSGDQGETWADITDMVRPLNAPRQIVAHQTSAGVSWIVSSDGIWETDDFGFEWELGKSGLVDFTNYRAGSLNALTNGAGDHLFLATSRGLYERAAGATMWDKIADTAYGDKNLVSLLLTESNPTLLWVNTEKDGVFVYRIAND